jgi:hypothetical protein
VVSSFSIYNKSLYAFLFSPKKILRSFPIPPPFYSHNNAMRAQIMNSKLHHLRRVQSSVLSRRNISPPSSGSKKPTEAGGKLGDIFGEILRWFPAWLTFRRLGMFLSPNYMTWQHLKPHSNQTMTHPCHVCKQQNIPSCQRNSALCTPMSCCVAGASSLLLHSSLC